jgi:hypothetical protein
MDPHNFHVFTDVLKAGGALVTMTTRNVGLCCNPVSFFKIRDIFANLDHLGSIFVTEKKWKFNPG